jgi:hypothetical protein
MWLCVYSKIRDWRSSFVSAFLYFGVFVWALTETLGFFKILGLTGLLCGWLGYNVVLLILVVLAYKKGTIQLKMPLFSLRWEYFVLGFIICVTFFTAIAYPPNNWDSMTYHLPRIEHWLQNKSLSHYYTSITRQVLSAPFAEMLILQGRALSGDDYLMNLVQWFSLFGSVIGISKIVSHLGMNKTTQIAAALFFATVPMAILQASSTQTDLVEAFCIICLTERFLAWRKTGTFCQGLDFGLALGLSILTKGTAYPIAFPLVLWFAIISVRNFRKRFAPAFLAALLCLALNFPHYTRNYVLVGEPLGIHAGTVSNFCAKSFVLTFAANINSNIAVPFFHGTRKKMAVVLEKIWQVLKVDKSIFPYGPPTINGPKTLGSFHEDTVKNFFHMILAIIVFVLFFKNVKNSRTKKYGLFALGSWCMFVFCIPWQPWITRLQLPLFALCAPVFAQALASEKHAKYQNCLLLFLSLFSILPLFLNRSRPLFVIPQITSQKTIWNSSREEILFNNRNQEYFKNYKGACETVAQTGVQNIGLIIGGDSWEYPLWQYFRKNDSNKNITIQHVKDNSIDRDVEALFVFEAPTPSLHLSFPPPLPPLFYAVMRKKHQAGRFCFKQIYSFNKGGS